MADNPHQSPSDADPADCQIAISLTDTERIDYQKAAERCGQSLEAWIRQRLAEAAKREAKES